MWFILIKIVIFTIRNNPNSYTNITTYVPRLILFNVAKADFPSRVADYQVLRDLVSLCILVLHHVLAILTQHFGFSVSVSAGGSGAASASAFCRCVSLILIRL